MSRLFFILNLAFSFSASWADDLKIDKVGPIEKVGPIKPVGKPKESTPAAATPTNPQSPPGGGISVQGTGSDFVDFSTRKPTSSGDQKFPEKDSTDALEDIVFGGHKKGDGGGTDDAEGSGSGEGNDALNKMLGSTPNLMELNNTANLAPIERPERDAPAGMMKVEMPERPSKNPKKNAPAQAGGNSAGC